MSYENKKKFEQMRTTEDFESLSSYQDPLSWEALNAEERELLGLLFAMHGDLQLQKGEEGAHASFERALQVSPTSARVLYRKGHALSKHENNAHFLKLAMESLRQSVAFDPLFYPAWYELACTASRMAWINRVMCSFGEADELFKHAAELSLSEDRVIQGDCYWRWGLCWFLSGKSSGELSDFHKALEKFQKAAELGSDQREFWNDYGNALVEYTSVAGHTKGFHESIGLYRAALKNSPDYFEAWYNLACTYHHLFLLDHEEQDFYSAEECYVQATRLEPEYGHLWLKWATLHLTYWKMKRNEELLFSSLKKFRRADYFEPKNPQILRFFGDALMQAAGVTDDLSFYKEAESKFSQSVEIEERDPLAWYLYGSCLNEMGRYFGEEEYYLRGIEKFRQGLKVEAKEPLLWYGLALSHFALGEMQQDKKMVELADKYCVRVEEFGGQAVPQFWCDWGAILIKLSEINDSVDTLELARQKFEQAIAFYNDLEELELLAPEIMYHYACVLDLLGDYYEDTNYFDKAITLFERLLGCDPENLSILYQLALAYSHLGEVSSDLQPFYTALEYFEQLYQKEPEDEMGLHDWGITLIHLAQAVHDPLRPEKSHEYYTLAENKLLGAAYLGSVQAYYNLACLYSICGQHKNALYYLEKAAKAGALPPVDDLMHDDWLEGIRETKQFRNFLNTLTKKQKT